MLGQTDSSIKRRMPSIAEDGGRSAAPRQREGIRRIKRVVINLSRVALDGSIVELEARVTLIQ